MPGKKMPKMTPKHRGEMEKMAPAAREKMMAEHMKQMPAKAKKGKK